MNKIITLLMTFSLTACVAVGDRLSELRAKKPTHDDFASSLASEYLDYAESLRESGHPIAANYFASKGLKALEQGFVEPENANWSDESEKSARINTNRNELLAVLTPDIQEIAPQKAARAQLLFDCSVKNENLCVKSFVDELADLQFIADALVHGEDNSFIVQFMPNSSTLDDQTNFLLDVISERVVEYGEYKVEIIPYSAIRNSSVKSRKLDNYRMLIIEQSLIKRGVNAGKIHSHKSRKSGNVSLSSDDAKLKPDNVEINIQTYGQSTEAMQP